MSNYTSHRVNAFQCKIMDNRGRHVGWTKRKPGKDWRLFDVNCEPIPHNHVASPDHAAIIFQSL